MESLPLWMECQESCISLRCSENHFKLWLREFSNWLLEMIVLTVLDTLCSQLMISRLLIFLTGLTLCKTSSLMSLMEALYTSNSGMMSTVWSNWETSFASKWRCYTMEFLWNLILASKLIWKMGIRISLVLILISELISLRWAMLELSKTNATSIGHHLLLIEKLIES